MTSINTSALTWTVCLKLESLIIFQPTWRLRARQTLFYFIFLFLTELVLWCATISGTFISTLNRACRVLTIPKTASLRLQLKDDGDEDADDDRLTLTDCQPPWRTNSAASGREWPKLLLFLSFSSSFLQMLLFSARSLRCQISVQRLNRDLTAGHSTENKTNKQSIKSKKKVLNII